MDELFNQTRGIFVNDTKEHEQFTKQIAFNVIPHIDVFMDDGATKEEWKMTAETRKILDKDIAVQATCVRVPVFVGHGEAVNIDCAKPLDEDEAREILRDAPGVVVVDAGPTKAMSRPWNAQARTRFTSAGSGRSDRQERFVDVVVSDNLRKGAALNTVQIAEMLVRKKAG